MDKSKYREARRHWIKRILQRTKVLSEVKYLVRYTEFVHYDKQLNLFA